MPALFRALGGGGGGSGRTISVTYETELDTKAELDITHITFLQDSLINQDLTINYLEDSIIPHLSAISEIQRIIDEIEGKPHRVRIHSITQNSPVTATVEGVAKATQILAELLIPWRRKHSQTLARLTEQEKLVAIEKTKAEVLEIRARAAKDRFEKERLQAEIGQKYAETEKIRLANEKTSLELVEAKIDLVLKFLDKVNPVLSEKERITYTTRLLPLFESIISNPIEISVLNKSDDQRRKRSRRND